MRVSKAKSNAIERIMRRFVSHPIFCPFPEQKVKREPRRTLPPKTKKIKRPVFCPLLSFDSPVAMDIKLNDIKVKTASI